VQAAEKGYVSYQLEVTNSGGHSSLPTKDNAIDKLAEGLSRLARFDFPASLNEITRSYFQNMAAIDPGPYADDMKVVAQSGHNVLHAMANLSRSTLFNALLRTTCVPTMISGGHAENALPQRANATVNCRILPGETPAEVETTLRRVLADEQIRFHPLQEAITSPASPVVPAVFDTVRKAAAAVWPSVPVLPVMDTGGSDAVWLRKAGIPTHGLSGVFLDEGDIRAHGRDERVPVEAFYRGLEFTYQLMREWGAVR
jgi:acetylornithine deacetylase/succinyl-diaminopimelate desuccinylase-like protein